MIKLNTNINSYSTMKIVLDFIEEIVGHSWMEDWVHGMRDNFGRLPQNAPPLAVNWLKAKDELAAYELTDKLMISESTARLLQLGSDLNLLKEHKDFFMQIPLLKGNVEKYSAVCYRMYIATNYYQQNIEFKLSQDLSQPDLTLFNCSKETPVITIAPVQESTSLLVNGVPSVIKNAVDRLPLGEGIVYIDFPLPPGFSTEQLLKKINNQHEFASLGDSISLIATFSYVERQNLLILKHSIFPLKQSQNRELLFKLI